MNDDWTCGKSGVVLENFFSILHVKKQPFSPSVRQEQSKKREKGEGAWCWFSLRSSPRQEKRLLLCRVTRGIQSCPPPHPSKSVALLLLFFLLLLLLPVPNRIRGSLALTHTRVHVQFVERKRNWSRQFHKQFRNFCFKKEVFRKRIRENKFYTQFMSSPSPFFASSPSSHPKAKGKQFLSSPFLLHPTNNDHLNLITHRKTGYFLCSVGAF